MDTLGLGPELLPLGWAIPVPGRGRALGNPPGTCSRGGPRCFSRGWHQFLVLFQNWDCPPGCRSKHEESRVWVCVCVCVRRWGDGWPLRDNRKEYKGPLAGVRAGKARRLLLRFRDSSPAVGGGGHSVPSPESGGSGKGRCLVVRLLSCSQFGNTGGGLLHW